jgi:predicted PurR-regulated permease PerM
MELAQESASKQVVESPQELHSTEAPRAAWLFLCVMLVGAGLYIVANYLRALAWALVFAVALWPFYDRVRRQTPPPFAKAVLPILFTALVGLAIFLLFATLAVDAIREVREVVEYGQTVEKSGIPVPDFVTRLPYVGQWVADRWREHLSHAGWAKEIVQQVNTSSARELGAALGANAVHRVVLFGVCLLTSSFCFVTVKAYRCNVEPHRKSCLANAGSASRCKWCCLCMERSTDSFSWRSERAFCWELFTFSPNCLTRSCLVSPPRSRL